MYTYVYIDKPSIHSLSSFFYALATPSLKIDASDLLICIQSKSFLYIQGFAELIHCNFYPAWALHNGCAVYYALCLHLVVGVIFPLELVANERSLKELRFLGVCFYLNKVIK